MAARPPCRSGNSRVGFSLRRASARLLERLLNGTMGHSILLVDDDAELGSLMTEFFSQHGFNLSSESDSRRGLAKALEGSFDLVLLDVMMPGLDGFEVLHQLRRRTQVPVIMLTARIAQA